jgi:hypothetical protein
MGPLNPRYRRQAVAQAAETGAVARIWALKRANTSRDAVAAAQTAAGRANNSIYIDAAAACRQSVKRTRLALVVQRAPIATVHDATRTRATRRAGRDCNAAAHRGARGGRAGGRRRGRPCRRWGPGPGRAHHAMHARRRSRRRHRHALAGEQRCVRAERADVGVRLASGARGVGQAGSARHTLGFLRHEQHARARCASGPRQAS